MYAALLRKNLADLRDRLWHGAVRSGILTIFVAILVVVGLAVGWHEHRKGHFARLKAEIRGIPSRSIESMAPRPGEQDVILLQRSPLPGGAGPEFLSATLLPGRGMNILQIRANLPDRGEVNLLASPSLEDAAKLLDDKEADPAAGLGLGAAIEAPWAGRIFGVRSSDGDKVISMWHGHRLDLPNDWGRAEAASIGGLLMPMPSSEVHTAVMPDGGAATAIFHAGSFEDQWLSNTVVTTMVQLGGRSIEINVTARNEGSEAEPVGLGWHPRFAIVSGQRQKVTLKLPNSMKVEVPNSRTGVPSGKLLPVAGTPYDFSKPEGAPLGTLSLDDTFVHLKPGLLDNGPTIEFRDTAAGFGLRITAITSSIKAIHIYAPANAGFIAIDPAMNYDDPFGHEWARGEDTGMVMLEPGQSVQWKIRLEIFPLQPSSAQQF